MTVTSLNCSSSSPCTLLKVGLQHFMSCNLPFIKVKSDMVYSTIVAVLIIILLVIRTTNIAFTDNGNIGLSVGVDYMYNSLLLSLTLLLSAAPLRVATADISAQKIW